jgi:hypothetical protein
VLALGIIEALDVANTSLTATNIEVAKAAISYALLDAAEAGERNVNRLAIAAVGRMAKYEGKLRYARSYGLGASPRRSA